LTHQYSLQQLNGSVVISCPQRDEVPGQLPLHEQPVVLALDVKRLHQVDWNGPLCQRQHLHFLASFGTSLFNDGLHQEAGALRISEIYFICMLHSFQQNGPSKSG